MVLISISLMTDNTEHNLMLLMTNCIFSGEKSILKSFEKFLNWVVCLLAIELQKFFIYFNVNIAQSCLTLCDPVNYSMEFSRPEFWNR